MVRLINIEIKERLWFSWCHISYYPFAVLGPRFVSRGFDLCDLKITFGFWEWLWDRFNTNWVWKNWFCSGNKKWTDSFPEFQKCLTGIGIIITIQIENNITETENRFREHHETTLRKYDPSKLMISRKYRWFENVNKPHWFPACSSCNTWFW